LVEPYGDLLKISEELSSVPLYDGSVAVERERLSL
jgi:hypothetical protein